VSYNKRDLLLYAVGIGYDTQLLLGSTARLSLALPPI